MVDLKIVADLGITAKSWRRLLEKPSRDDVLATVGNEREPVDNTRSEKLLRLRNRIRSRLNGGRDYNLANWQHYHNLDLLWDAPFRQVSPTAVAAITTKYRATARETYDALKAMNLDLGSFLAEQTDKDAKTSQTKYTLNIPTFFHVTVPLMRALLTVRKAKLINDRNLKPLFKFQPIANTPETRLHAEIVTDLVAACLLRPGAG